MELLDWVDIQKLDWDLLSKNPNAIELLEANPDKINWYYLSKKSKCYSFIKSKS